MIKIGILEDNKQDAKALTELLNKYSKEKQMIFEMHYFTNSTNFLQKYDPSFDLLFVVIELPDFNGMVAMKKLRAIDERVMIIFVTNLAQYAVNGYEVGAFDFVIKPLAYYNLAIKLNRALEKLELKKEKHIWVSTRNEKRKIEVSKLKYVEVIKHKIIYHLTDGVISTQGVLKEVAEELKNYSFCFCNQCYLVNLYYVTGISGSDCLLGDEKLKISAPKKKEFLHALNNYLAGGYSK